jgi:hypothetical protein
MFERFVFAPPRLLLDLSIAFGFTPGRGAARFWLGPGSCGFLSRNLGAPFPGFGKRNGDGLFPAFYSSALSASA